MAWDRMKVTLRMIADIEDDLRDLVKTRNKLNDSESEVLWWKLVQLESLVRYLSEGKHRSKVAVDRMDLPQDVKDEMKRLEEPDGTERPQNDPRD